MALRVIGAGFGRTGTLSLKTALERLGFDPCYHMAEVFAHPEHAPVWVNAAEGRDVDFEALFDSYEATVDWPGCAFWRELADRYPDAKVVLSVRPPERWYASFHDTIYQVLTREFPPHLPEALLPVRDVGSKVVEARSFGPGIATMSEAEMIAKYEAHNAAVRAGIAPDRLLEFDVSQGWEPLCQFLGVPVPEEDFPNVNDREMFRRIFRLDELPPPS